MSADQQDIEVIDASTLLYPDSYLLRALDLYNWGPFAGRHQVQIDPEGSAIIGATGSGKTTLVDGLMTLLCDKPKYNLASTGGHESDRDWVSYVRGKSGEGNTVDASHIARPGKTVSALAARFGDGSNTLLIGGIFWLEGSSSSQSDLHRLWFFDRNEQADLDRLLETHDQGGYRALKQMEKRTPDLSITKTKNAYLNRLQRFFGVGKNAFTLLNRAAGLKQLNSIDDLFRDLVLEDNSMFERATEVVQGFDTLSHIHEELQTARRQRDTLLPIRSEFGKHSELSQQAEEQGQLLKILPLWYAEQRHRLLQAEADALRETQQRLALKISELEQGSEQARNQEETARLAYMEAGGGNLEETRKTVQRLRQELHLLTQQARQYQSAMRRLGLSETLDPAAFEANQPRLAETHQALQQDLTQAQAPWHQAITDVHNLKSGQTQTQDQLDQVSQRPSSNIPPAPARFRQILAEQLNLPETDLPFLAELVEVKPEQAEWRGAIERALGAQRLRILVAAEVMPQALDWINQRDNRLDVRLLEVRHSPPEARFHPDGFVRKLNFKPHPYREEVKALLAGMDLHCVDSPQALRDTAHGLTREGMMSTRPRHFEKRDAQALNQNWMTGFDNHAQLAQLRDTLKQQQTDLRQAKQRLEAAEARVQGIKDELLLIKRLQELTFSDIDTHRCQQEIDDYENRLRQMERPDSDTAKAHQHWQQAQELARSMLQDLAHRQAEHQQQTRQLEQIEQRRQNAHKAMGEGLDEAQRAQAEQHLNCPEDSSLDGLMECERQQTRHSNEQLVKLKDKIGRSERILVRHMGQAKHADTGALTETGTERQDIPDYLSRLETLEQKDLPGKEREFLDYLRQSSDQSVSQLIHAVENEVASIKERIDELNTTMDKVDFQPGRFLRLSPEPVVHESIRTLLKAQRHLNSARTEDDAGESHYQALRAVVQLVQQAAENRRTRGAKALLDPRYRLQFKALVIDRAEQKIIHSFSGSQGGSGGEKEIIASYILTASLSYALCPPGTRRPLFGTIVLDEAFSKSSQAVAGRIVWALREFGLHPLFVTPNKEMQLLRTHTRSAVLIHRKGNLASTTSMSWEQLRAKADQVRRAQTRS